MERLMFKSQSTNMKDRHAHRRDLMHYHAPFVGGKKSRGKSYTNN